MKKIVFLVVAFWAVELQTLAQVPDLFWAKGVGSTGIDGVMDMETDANGNIYVLGDFSGTVDLDPGTGTASLTAVGTYDIYVAKYNAMGNYVWAFRLEVYNIDGGITLDHNGDIIVAGSFSDYNGTYIDFDPGPDTANITSTSEDIFVAKYDANGVYQWAFSLGSTNVDVGADVAIDSNNDVIIAGTFQSDSMDFDPGPATAYLGGNGSGYNSTDLFLAKYSSSGAYQWAFNLKGDSPFYIGPSKVEVDGLDNIIISGGFRGSNVDFDPDTGTASLSSNTGSTDIFLAKYTSSGAYLWAFPVGGINTDYINSEMVDDSNNIYLTGRFDGSNIDFNPGTGVNNLSSGNSDAFLAKYSSSGNYLWAFKISSSGEDIGYALAMDSMDNITLTGTFSGITDFDPGTGSALLNTSGKDLFVAAYDSSGNYQWVFDIDGTTAIISYAMVYTSSGSLVMGINLYGSADFDPSAGTTTMTSAGLNDAFFVKYVFCGPPPAPVNTTPSSGLVVCTGNSATLTASGTGILTWHSASVGGVLLGTGNLYTTPALTVNKTYYVQDNNCENQPSATRTAITVGVNPNIPNTNVQVNGDTLISQATGVNYQWIDCDNNNAPIAGANGQSFVPTSDGNYAVAVSFLGCVDTSTCFNMIVEDVEELNAQLRFVVSPNPANNLVSVTINNEIEKGQVLITDIRGRIVYQQVLKTKKTDINLSHFENGVYLVTVKNATAQAQKKLVVVK